MEKQAIVIMYDGKQVSSRIVNAIIDLLARNHVAVETSGRVILFGEDDIARILVKDTVGGSAQTLGSVVINVEESREEAVTKAVIAIGERFGELLKKHYAHEFNTSLMYTYVIAAAKGCDKELVDAVSTLAGEDSLENIDKDVLQKYHFGLHHLTIIKEIYNTTCAGRIVL